MLPMVDPGFWSNEIEKFDKKLQNPLTDPRECQECSNASSLGPNSFILMQFSVKILLNNRFLPQTQGLGPPNYLRNPGSATGTHVLCSLDQWQIGGTPPAHATTYGPKFSRFHAVFRKIWRNHMLAPLPSCRGLVPPPTDNSRSAPVGQHIARPCTTVPLTALFTKPLARQSPSRNDPQRPFQPHGPFMAYGSFRNCTRQNYGTAGNREASGFVNSSVRIRSLLMVEENLEGKSHQNTLVIILQFPAKCRDCRISEAVADLGGVREMAPVKFFFHFHAVFGQKLCQIIGRLPPPPELTPSPLGNPGSATAFNMDVL